MIGTTRLLVLMALPIVVACSFKPSKGRRADAFFILSYERPTPSQVHVTYVAVREHELQKLCGHLSKQIHGGELARSPTFVPGTPEHCFFSQPRMLRPGDRLSSRYDFPPSGKSHSTMRTTLNVRMRVPTDTVESDVHIPFDD